MKEEQKRVIVHEIKNVPLQYSCAALPPVGMSMDDNYTFGKDVEGYYFSYSDIKTYETIEYIQMLFTPKDKTWNEIIK